ncbi:MAG: cytochrome b/b6 domain-containing protein [Aestuariivita sp.]|nr:cytochrome b/b6 domain-containing protein [Aestuariivita sp.]
MQFRNTSRNYGVVSRSFHWFLVVLILVVIPLGFFANLLPFNTDDQLASKAFYFSWHKTIGIIALFFALIRIVWTITQKKPVPVKENSKLEQYLASIIHFLLYISLISVPLTGWAYHAASEGYAPVLLPLGQELPFIPNNEAIAILFANLHNVLIWLFLLSTGLHITGALKHHVWDKDYTLKRMLIHVEGVNGHTTQIEKFVPGITALIIWSIVVAIVTLNSLTAEVNSIETSPKTEITSGNWAVQQGKLEISVNQFGIPITGVFENWSGTIQFEPRELAGEAGMVDITIDINSLDLGSVTENALGKDFLNSQEFPTSNFSAIIRRTSNHYVAEGTLTIRNDFKPVNFPLDLQIIDNVANVKGKLKVDRLDFKIGENYLDNSTVGLEVQIEFSLIAHKS